MYKYRKTTVSMLPGTLKCERENCGKPAVDFERIGREKVGWPDPLMPIALCPLHSKNRTPYVGKYKFKNLMI